MLPFPMLPDLSMTLNASFHPFMRIRKDEPSRRTCNAPPSIQHRDRQIDSALCLNHLHDSTFSRDASASKNSSDSPLETHFFRVSIQMER
jgi:hypothetical protein